MTVDRMFEEAKDAVLKGQRSRARDLLTRLLRANQSNPNYWLWMSTVVTTEKERIYCLESVIRLDPRNKIAKRGLILLGAREAGKDVRPVPPVIREWSKDIKAVSEPPKNFFQRVWTNPTLRILSFLGAGVLVIGLILIAIFGPSRQNIPAIVMVSITPRPTSTRSPTDTPRPTNTLVVRSPTATFIGPTPLWMFLDATYTPIPLYVNTPHPILEAYRAAMRAYARNDFKTMLSFMQQASSEDPNSADLRYYVGEAYRLQGNFEDALAAYESAIEINQNFAPAYLGRVRSNQILNPGIDMISDLDRAIELDPSFVDAYLLRAEYRFNHEDFEGALEDLEIVNGLFPESPLLYAIRADVYLNLGENAAALEDARMAYDLDITLLRVYLTLSKAYLANENPRQALKFIEIYTRYVEDNAGAWNLTGMAQYQIGKYEAAIESFEKVLDLDDTLVSAYWYRGLSYLQLDDAVNAVRDLITAVRAEPDSFDINLALGRALFAEGRYEDAIGQFNTTENLALSEEEQAQIFFYRAQAYQADNNLRAAQTDFESLLALPDGIVPADWIEIAQQQLLIINPPTDTVTPTPSPSQTATKIATSTSTATPSRTQTATSTRSSSPTRTKTPTNTPRSTRIPSLTPSPSITATP